MDSRPTDQSRSPDRGDALRARSIYVETVRTFAGRAGFLLALGALVFIPLGCLDAFADRIASIHVSSPGELTSLAIAAAVVGFAVQAITGLLGEVFYSGAVALTLASGDGRERPTLWQVARSLSYGRLIAVDIAFGVIVVVGLLALVVPGVIALTWFALAGPLVEIEDCGAKEAFARSRALVRGHFWTVVAVLAPLTLASELATDAVLTLSHGAIHNAFLGAWVGESVTNIAISPFYAVAAVLLTLKLRRRAA